MMRHASPPREPDYDRTMRHKLVLRPRIRITTDRGVIAMGPGKADLLDAICNNGTIRAAAEDLGMSYMRAWSLVQTMNAAFRSPLVEKVRGGTAQGGARLTRRGEAVLRLYRRMTKDAETAAARYRRELQKHF